MVEHSTRRIGEIVVPIKLNIDHSNNLATFTVIGEVTFEETMKVLDDYIKAGLVRFDLIDALRGTVKQFTFTQLDQIVQWGETYSFARPPDSKTAFVVPRDAGLETKGFFQVLSQFNRASWPVSVVHSLPEAYEWLDIPQEGSGKE